MTTATRMIRIVHPSVGSVGTCPPQAFFLWAAHGWQLVDPTDEQYLEDDPPAFDVDVVTTDELGTQIIDTITDVLPGILTDLLGTIDVGPAGASAYEVAVANGFVGNQAAWLLSLKGAKGDTGNTGNTGAQGLSAYQVALANGYVGTVTQWLASLKGESGTNGTAGASAYAVAVANGFVGSQSAWLLSLKGTPGTDGAPGTPGTPGTPGVGMPTGGATGQIAAKLSGTNYDIGWIDAPIGGGTGSHVGEFYPDDPAYGASTDPAVDSRAAIQATIDAAAAAGGGTVFLTRKYGWKGILTVKDGVILQGGSTRQITALDASPVIPGLISLDGTAQLKVGDWTGAGHPGGVKNLYVDGNNVGAAIGTVAKAGLVRIAGVQATIEGLYANRSAGDGIVYDGLQNSAVTGGGSAGNGGVAFVLDNGPGSVVFQGGYYGTSAKGAFEFRDTVGENSIYGFGPTNNTFVGTIFESYNEMNPPHDFHGHIRCGVGNVFYGCNFTGGAANDAACSVLIDKLDSAINTSTTFDNCLFWTREGHDAIRVVGSQVVTVSGFTQIADDGTHHTPAVFCLDTGVPKISISGEVFAAGGVGGTTMFRLINGASLLGSANLKDTGTSYRLRAGQVVSYRRETDGANRQYTDQDGSIYWLDGVNGATIRAKLARGAGGTGLDLTGGPLHMAAGFKVTGPVTRVQPAVVAAGAAETADAGLSSVYRYAWTTGAATTFTFAGAVNGAELTLQLSATGAPTNITWPAAAAFADGGAGPQVAAGGYLRITFIYDATAAKWVEHSRSGVGGGGAGTEGPQGPEGPQGRPGPVGPIGAQIAAVVSAGQTYVMDPEFGTDHTLTVTGDCTITRDNMTDGQGMSLTLIQDGSGGHIVTLDLGIGSDTIVLTTEALHFDLLTVDELTIGTFVAHKATGPLPPTYWSPNLLADKILWYDAAAIPGDATDVVASLPNFWDEADANIVTGAPTIQEENAERFIRFVKANSDSLEADLTGAPYAQPLTVALLARVRTTAAGHAVLDDNGLTGAEIYASGPGPNVYWTANSAGATGLTVSTDWEVVVVVLNGASSKVRRDGTQANVNAGAKGWVDRFRIARDQVGTTYGDIDFREVFMVGHAADATEVDKMEAFLGEKRDNLNGA